MSIPADDWFQNSPWSLPIKNVAIEMVRLNHWHFLKTGNPLFWVRALHIGRCLAPDHEELAWARACFTKAAAQLNWLIDQPPNDKRPDANGNHWESINNAIGFSIAPYYNPLREVRMIIEEDKIYLTIHGHGKPLTGEKGAFLAVAYKYGVSEQKVRAIYYDRKKLASRPVQ